MCVKHRLLCCSRMLSAPSTCTRWMTCFCISDPLILTPWLLVCCMFQICTYRVRQNIMCVWGAQRKQVWSPGLEPEYMLKLSKCSCASALVSFKNKNHLVLGKHVLLQNTWFCFWDHSRKMSWRLIKSIQWFHAYKCWGTVSSSGLWVNPDPNVWCHQGSVCLEEELVLSSKQLTWTLTFIACWFLVRIWPTVTNTSWRDRSSSCSCWSTTMFQPCVTKGCSLYMAK